MARFKIRQHAMPDRAKRIHPGSARSGHTGQGRIEYRRDNYALLSN